MEKRELETLVELRHGDAVAAIQRGPDGWLWLSSDIRRRGGTGISDYGGFREGWGDYWVVGGALPPPAVAAEVLDPAGDWLTAQASNGAWVAVVTGVGWSHEVVVRYRDASGEIVARPLPQGTPRAAVADAQERCPVCDSISWSVAFGELSMLRPEGWPDHREDYADHRTLVCDMCGHQEAVGAFISVELDEGGENVGPAEQARVDELFASQRRDMIRALEQAPFSVYGLDASWPGAREVTGEGSSNGTIDTLTLEFGQPDDPPWIRIETVQPDDGPPLAPKRRAEQAYLELLDLGSPPRLSEAALSLWFSARRREREQATAGQSAREATVIVGGEAIPATVIGTEQRWAAAVEVPAPADGPASQPLAITLVADGVLVSDLRLDPAEAKDYR